MKITKTDRGFMMIKIEDSRGCVVRLQESSAADDRYVWIFTDDPNDIYGTGIPAPHLTRKQARKVAKALLKFADELL